MRKIPTLSLFSGAGGLDIGFHRAGFDILACVELEPKYCKTLLANRQNQTYCSKDLEVHNIDIREFDPRDYVDFDIECIIGGPPCQTFSAAGRRSGGVIGTDDDRGQLYESYCGILDVIKPKAFIFENVYGLPGANGGGPWREIVEAFRNHGYTLHFEVLDSADYGVPQHRERLVMVGVRNDDSSFSFPLPICGPDSSTGSPLVSVYDAISDLQDKGEPYSAGLGGLYGHLLPDVPEGLNYAYFTAEMGHPEPVFAWRSKFHDLLYKVNRNEPCRTIKANPGKFTGPLHWKNRHFTKAELMRLQTFPDDYEIIGSYSQVVEQIGNSVPPAMAEVIAWSVRHQIIENKPKTKLKYERRPSGFSSTFRQRQRSRSKQFKEIAQSAIQEKYGSVVEYRDPKGVKRSSKTCYIVKRDIFNREVSKRKPQNGSNHLSLTLTEAASRIRLDIDGHTNTTSRPESLSAKIEVTGLKKYLPNFDSITVYATTENRFDLFNVWKEVEVALVERSRFFTLIDIYGHYANKGDAVNIKTSIALKEPNPLFELIEYFSQTSNCGKFEPLDSFMEKMGLEEEELDSLVIDMRSLRYDIRTPKTHPIIGEGRLICTYPFPLLSERALVESKVKLNRDRKAYA
ncbi:DNA cytosine methyltransferase [Pseudomonadales bacterium]|nr:DNA cytosine methyltransferase [Pseudomonadales bacterium]